MTTLLKQLNHRHFERGEKRSIRGSVADTFLSPYDIPRSITISVHGDAEKVDITFEYLGDEASGAKKDSDHGVQYELGENSRRLLSLSVDLKKLSPIPSNQAETVAAVLSAINGLLASLSQPVARRPSRIINYTVITDIINRHGASMLSDSLQAS